MQPIPTLLLNKLNIEHPLIGIYDTNKYEDFKHLVITANGRHICFFMFFKQWKNNKHIKLTSEKFGCGGCGYHMFSIKGRSREDFVKFLADDEGLKANHELMNQWLDQEKTYQPENEAIIAGPLNEKVYGDLKTVTFFVNPDQLSALMIGAQYFHSPNDPPPVLAPFGSGCMQILPLFEDLSIPQAIIGATDLAMRKYLPPEIIAFTVTKPMYENLCKLDEKSFLSKPFLKDLLKARKNS
jgi:hypothetical protein